MSLNLNSLLQQYAQNKNMFVLTCVGSVDGAFIRLASAASGENKVIRLEGRYEILCLVGTVCSTGLHLHITLGDEGGSVIGGHLLNATIYTTAEIVLGELTNVILVRRFDQRTGFPELCVLNRSESLNTTKKLILRNSLSSIFSAATKYLNSLVSKIRSGNNHSPFQRLCGGDSRQKSANMMKNSAFATHRTLRGKPSPRAAMESKTRQSMVYEDVAAVLERYTSHRGSLKGLCLAANIRRKGATMALACAILRSKSSLDAILQDVGLIDEEKHHSPWLLRAIVYDSTLGGRVVAPAAHCPGVQECMRLVRKRRGELLDALRRLCPLSADKGSTEGMRHDVEAMEGTALRVATLPRQATFPDFAWSAMFAQRRYGLMVLGP